MSLNEKLSKKKCCGVKELKNNINTCLSENQGDLLKY